MEFIPFAEAKKLDHHQVIGVDCFLPGRLNLSHWRGAGPPAELAEDTSAAIAINAVVKGAVPVEARFVTNNHFDVDGFIGIWSLLNPKLALMHQQLLKAMALLGDFRELPENAELADQALKLVVWLNSVEKRKFYAPFGKAYLEEEACVEKYIFFLSAFEEVLIDPEAFREDWEEEYEMVRQHLSLLANQGSLKFYEDIRLLVVRAPKPLHYYALFGKSATADMVLTIYPESQYELEYKYTTWVDAFGRKPYPRINFQLLMDKLNGLEISGEKWTGADVTDTGPILRLGPSINDKEIRFDHPFNRRFYSSSIAPELLEDTIVSFYHKAYQSTERKKIWTWQEIRQVNERLMKTWRK
ncbi:MULTISPECIES: DUF6687 family protein [unclassified Imperialibacter]|uniref:DUF6687 family protein n=1 Tax=unclassified Imperialibacter TaxID=2629706 RepID=UPI00125547E2|nr:MULTISPECIES: DUF6687 family protein [unclassified Imperialibacter]CAD5289650.1 conserved hypothetical protein [Imperialibacter sp. 89]CAD5289914.1 conserved hypothetical protein [Imperialibacter sp. 75]VVT34552.1 conserved hypothetical protein [Imperialibacter sp. EC-SDR9]